MKIIALMPVKNEDWILERSLKSLSLFCDNILVADQGSNDATLSILKSNPKVQIIQNERKFHSNLVRWDLLEASRKFDGENFIITLDADEIITSNILTKELIDRLSLIPSGEALEFRWIQLWRSPFLYRDDNSIWSGQWKCFAFRDDKKIKYDSLLVFNDHTSRIPNQGLKGIHRISDLSIMHYQFANFERMLAKQRWYRVTELINSVSLSARINARYIITRDERKLHLSDIPLDWIKGWEDNGIDLSHFETSNLYWFDVEVLRFFHKYGTPKFGSLDIWDISWEDKRQIALSKGIDGLPEIPIKDPRNLEQKQYHKYLDHHYSNPFWRTSPIDMAKIGLRKIGIRRNFLERIGLLKPKDI